MPFYEDNSTGAGIVQQLNAPTRATDSTRDQYWNERVSASQIKTRDIIPKVIPAAVFCHETAFWNCNIPGLRGHYSWQQQVL